MLKFQLLITFVLSLLAFASCANAETHYCNSSISCPEEYPCCSASENVCGTGTYCLGGCDPRFSYNISACLAMPICQTKLFEFNSTDFIEDSSSYLGNASETSWIYSGYLLDYDDSVLLAMPKNSGGTVISSTFFVWYGKVSIKFKSSHGAGVVSANILYSNVQDEIDIEFIGNALEQPQSNYYFQGVLNYTNEINLTATDTFENWHTYTVDWKEDEIIWSVDDDEIRTLKKEDTYNATDDTYYFPQTPSQVQISIWPGGNSTNAEGTIEWSGGAINWDASDLTDPGYLYAELQSVDVECYDPPRDTLETGSSAYVFNSSTDFTQDSIMITDDQTYLYNLAGTGLDPDYGKPEEEDDEEDDDATSTIESQVVSTIAVVSNGSTSKVVTTSTHTTISVSSASTSSATGAVVTDFIQASSSDSGKSSNGSDKLLPASSLIMLILSSLYLI